MLELTQEALRVVLFGLILYLKKQLNSYIVIVRWVWQTLYSFRGLGDIFCLSKIISKVKINEKEINARVDTGSSKSSFIWADIVFF